MAAPLMETYLHSLPGGLDAYPELQHRGSVMAPFLEGVDVQRLPTLPPPVAALLEHRPRPDAWVPEVHATALYLACADTCFESPDAYVAFAAKANRALMDSPIYGILFRLLGPRRVVSGLGARWAAFHRGSTLEMLHLEEKLARARLTSPPYAVPPLLAACYGTGLVAAIELSGVTVEQGLVQQRDERTVDFEVRWA